MVEVKETKDEIMMAIKGLSPTWPIQLIDHLTNNEWHFTLNGVDVLLLIDENIHF